MADEDYKLVESFLDGNEGAFNKIVYKYQQKIYWHARRMIGNHLDADEITQEVLIVLYKKLKLFKFKSSLYTWIYSITSRRSINYIKRSKIKELFTSESSETMNLVSHDNVVKNLEDKEKLRKLEKILLKLPVKQREVFILKNFEELSYNEISKITGKSVGGLKANYFYAIKKVTELLGNE
ncbi:RNA polymerase sigma factor [Bacteroidota bacterium]